VTDVMDFDPKRNPTAPEPVSSTISSSANSVYPAPGFVNVNHVSCFVGEEPNKILVVLIFPSLPSELNSYSP